MKESELLNQKLLDCVKNEPQNLKLQSRLRREFEQYYEEHFLLKHKLFIINTICNLKDKEFIQEYFNFCYQLSNCADETLGEILFEIYQCQPDFFLEEIVKLKRDEFNVILKKSQDAFIMNTQGTENQIKDYTLLKSRLFKLIPDR
jgi:hypothetical protein